jgi:hypothetical protein
MSDGFDAVRKAVGQSGNNAQPSSDNSVWDNVGFNDEIGQSTFVELISVTQKEIEAFPADSPQGKQANSVLVLGDFDASVFEFALSGSANHYLNFGGENEKWITGNWFVEYNSTGAPFYDSRNIGRQYYYITPGGELFAWDHSSGGTFGTVLSGNLVSIIGTEYYNNVKRLVQLVPEDQPLVPGVVEAVAVPEVPSSMSMPDIVPIVGNVVSPLSGHELVQIRIAATDASGNPISNINVGEEYYIRAFVQDLREDQNPAYSSGIFAAYLNITYNKDLTEDKGTIGHVSPYDGFGQAGNLKEGSIEHAGGVDGLSPVGPSEFEFFNVLMTAIAPGKVIFSGSAPDTIDHHILLFGYSGGNISDNEIRFSDAELVISGEFSPDNSDSDSVKVIKVNSLAADDTDPDYVEGDITLHHALSTPGERIIVFEVGGIIDLRKSTRINPQPNVYKRMLNMVVTEPNCVVAGETAPEPGITVIGASIAIEAPHVLLRHIAIRSGWHRSTKTNGESSDALQIKYRHNKPWGNVLKNILIDHCSLSWGVDEIVDIEPKDYSANIEGQVSYVTIQNSIIAEGLEGAQGQSAGLSMGSGVNKVQIKKCVFAHFNKRDPFNIANGYVGKENSAICTNSIIYNPQQQVFQVIGAGTEGPKVSVLGNIVVPGRNTRPWAKNEPPTALTGSTQGQPPYTNFTGLFFVYKKDGAGAKDGVAVYLEDNELISNDYLVPRPGSPVPDSSGGYDADVSFDAHIWDDGNGSGPFNITGASFVTSYDDAANWVVKSDLDLISSTAMKSNDYRTILDNVGMNSSRSSFNTSSKTYSSGDTDDDRIKNDIVNGTGYVKRFEVGYRRDQNGQTLSATSDVLVTYPSYSGTSRTYDSETLLPIPLGPSGDLFIGQLSGDSDDPPSGGPASKWTVPKQLKSAVYDYVGTIPSMDLPDVKYSGDFLESGLDPVTKVPVKRISKNSGTGVRVHDDNDIPKAKLAFKQYNTHKTSVYSSFNSNGTLLLCEHIPLELTLLDNISTSVIDQKQLIEEQTHPYGAMSSPQIIWNSELNTDTTLATIYPPYLQNDSPIFSSVAQPTLPGRFADRIGQTIRFDNSGYFSKFEVYLYGKSPDPRRLPTVNTYIIDNYDENYTSRIAGKKTEFLRMPHGGGYQSYIMHDDVDWRKGGNPNSVWGGSYEIAFSSEDMPSIHGPDLLTATWKFRDLPAGDYQISATWPSIVMPGGGSGYGNQLGSVPGHDNVKFTYQLLSADDVPVGSRYDAYVDQSVSPNSFKARAPSGKTVSEYDPALNETANPWSVPPPGLVLITSATWEILASTPNPDGILTVEEGQSIEVIMYQHEGLVVFPETEMRVPVFADAIRISTDHASDVGSLWQRGTSRSAGWDPTCEQSLSGTMSVEIIDGDDLSAAGASLASFHIDVNVTGDGQWVSLDLINTLYPKGVPVAAGQTVSVILHSTRNFLFPDANTLKTSLLARTQEQTNTISPFCIATANSPYGNVGNGTSEWPEILGKYDPTDILSGRRYSAIINHGDRIWRTVNTYYPNAAEIVADIEVLLPKDASFDDHGFEHLPGKGYNNTISRCKVNRAEDAAEEIIYYTQNYWQANEHDIPIAMGFQQRGIVTVRNDAIEFGHGNKGYDEHALARDPQLSGSVARVMGGHRHVGLRFHSEFDIGGREIESAELIMYMPPDRLAENSTQGSIDTHLNNAGQVDFDGKWYAEDSNEPDEWSEENAYLYEFKVRFVDPILDQSATGKQDAEQRMDGVGNGLIEVGDFPGDNGQLRFGKYPDVTSHGGASASGIPIPTAFSGQLVTRAVGFMFHGSEISDDLVGKKIKSAVLILNGADDYDPDHETFIEGGDQNVYGKLYGELSSGSNVKAYPFVDTYESSLSDEVSVLSRNRTTAYKTFNFTGSERAFRNFECDVTEVTQEILDDGKSILSYMWVPDEETLNGDAAFRTIVGSRHSLKGEDFAPRLRIIVEPGDDSKLISKRERTTEFVIGKSDEDHHGYDGEEYEGSHLYALKRVKVNVTSLIKELASKYSNNLHYFNLFWIDQAAGNQALLTPGFYNSKSFHSMGWGKDHYTNPDARKRQPSRTDTEWGSVNGVPPSLHQHFDGTSPFNLADDPDNEYISDLASIVYNTMGNSPWSPELKISFKEESTSTQDGIFPYDLKFRAYLADDTAEGGVIVYDGAGPQKAVKKIEEGSGPGKDNTNTKGLLVRSLEDNLPPGAYSGDIDGTVFDYEPLLALEAAFQHDVDGSDGFLTGHDLDPKSIKWMPSDFCVIDNYGHSRIQGISEDYIDGQNLTVGIDANDRRILKVIKLDTDGETPVKKRKRFPFYILNCASSVPVHKTVVLDNGESVERSYMAVIGTPYGSCDTVGGLRCDAAGGSTGSNDTWTDNVTNRPVTAHGAYNGDLWLYIINLNSILESTTSDYGEEVIAAFNLSGVNEREIYESYYNHPAFATSFITGIGGQDTGLWPTELFASVSDPGTIHVRQDIVTVDGTNYFVGPDEESLQFSQDGRHVLVKYAGVDVQGKSRDIWRMFDVGDFAYKATNPSWSRPFADDSRKPSVDRKPNVLVGQNEIQRFTVSWSNTSNASFRIFKRYKNHPDRTAIIPASVFRSAGGLTGNDRQNNYSSSKFEKYMERQFNNYSPAGLNYHRSTTDGNRVWAENPDACVVRFVSNVKARGKPETYRRSVGSKIVERGWPGRPDVYTVVFDVEWSGTKGNTPPAGTNQIIHYLAAYDRLRTVFGSRPARYMEPTGRVEIIQEGTYCNPHIWLNRAESKAFGYNCEPGQPRRTLIPLVAAVVAGVTVVDNLVGPIYRPGTSGNAVADYKDYGIRPHNFSYLDTGLLDGRGTDQGGHLLTDRGATRGVIPLNQISALSFAYGQKFLDITTAAPDQFLAIASDSWADVTIADSYDCTGLVRTTTTTTTTAVPDITVQKLYYVSNSDNNGLPNTIRRWPPERLELGKNKWLDAPNDEILVSDQDGATDIAIDNINQKMYWTIATSVQNSSIPNPAGAVPSVGKIMRADLDGTNVEDITPPGGRSINPHGIALDVVRGKMYWLEDHVDDSAARGEVRRANLDGSGEQLLTTTDPPLQSSKSLTLEEVPNYFTSKSAPTDNIISDIKTYNLGSSIESIVYSGALRLITGSRGSAKLTFPASVDLTNILVENVQSGPKALFSTGTQLSPLGYTYTATKTTFFPFKPEPNYHFAAVESLFYGIQDSTGSQLVGKQSWMPVNKVSEVVVMLDRQWLVQDIYRPPRSPVIGQYNTRLRYHIYKGYCSDAALAIAKRQMTAAAFRTYKRDCQNRCIRNGQYYYPSQSPCSFNNNHALDKYIADSGYFGFDIDNQKFLRNLHPVCERRPHDAPAYDSIGVVDRVPYPPYTSADTASGETRKHDVYEGTILRYFGAPVARDPVKDGPGVFDYSYGDPGYEAYRKSHSFAPNMTGSQTKVFSWPIPASIDLLFIDPWGNTPLSSDHISGLKDWLALGHKRLVILGGHHSDFANHKTGSAYHDLVQQLDVGITVKNVHVGASSNWRAKRSSGHPLVDGGASRLEHLGLYRPSRLALDLENGHMYWTEYATADADGPYPGRLRRANLSGSSKVILRDGLTGIDNVRGIDLDVKNQHIYLSTVETIPPRTNDNRYPEHGTAKILKLDFDGSDVSTVGSRLPRGVLFNYHYSLGPQSPNDIILDLDNQYVYVANHMAYERTADIAKGDHIQRFGFGGDGSVILSLQVCPPATATGVALAKVVMPAFDVQLQDADLLRHIAGGVIPLYDSKDDIYPNGRIGRIVVLNCTKSSEFEDRVSYEINPRKGFWSCPDNWAALSNPTSVKFESQQYEAKIYDITGLQNPIRLRSGGRRDFSTLHAAYAFVAYGPDREYNADNTINITGGLYRDEIVAYNVEDPNVGMVRLTHTRTNAWTKGVPGSGGKPAVVLPEPEGNISTEFSDVSDVNVLKVTTLSPTGPGSLYEALTTQGPRIIVFEVGGVIDFRNADELQGESAGRDVILPINIDIPNCVVAGETAPDPGITIIGTALLVRASNVLIRNIYIRHGDHDKASTGIEATGQGVALGVIAHGPDPTIENILIDHCSLSWGLQACAKIQPSTVAGSTCRYITFQNCIISEGLSSPTGAPGLLMSAADAETGSNHILVKRCLYAHIGVAGPFDNTSARAQGQMANSAICVNSIIYNPQFHAASVSGAGLSGPQLAMLGNIVVPGLFTKAYRKNRLSNLEGGNEYSHDGTDFTGLLYVRSQSAETIAIYLNDNELIKNAHLTGDGGFDYDVSIDARRSDPPWNGISGTPVTSFVNSYAATGLNDWLNKDTDLDLITSAVLKVDNYSILLNDVGANTSRSSFNGVAYSGGDSIDDRIKNELLNLTGGILLGLEQGSETKAGWEDAVGGYPTYDLVSRIYDPSTLDPVPIGPNGNHIVGKDGYDPSTDSFADPFYAKPNLIVSSDGTKLVYNSTWTGEGGTHVNAPYGPYVPGYHLLIDLVEAQLVGPVDGTTTTTTTMPPDSNSRNGIGVLETPVAEFSGQGDYLPFVCEVVNVILKPHADFFRDSPTETCSPAGSCLINPIVTTGSAADHNNDERMTVPGLVWSGLSGYNTLSNGTVVNNGIGPFYPNIIDPDDGKFVQSWGQIFAERELIIGFNGVDMNPGDNSGPHVDVNWNEVIAINKATLTLKFDNIQQQQFDLLPSDGIGTEITLYKDIHNYSPYGEPCAIDQFEISKVYPSPCRNPNHSFFAAEHFRRTISRSSDINPRQLPSTWAEDRDVRVTHDNKIDVCPEVFDGSCDRLNGLFVGIRRLSWSRASVGGANNIIAAVETIPLSDGGDILGEVVLIADTTFLMYESFSRGGQTGLSGLANNRENQQFMVNLYPECNPTVGASASVVNVVGYKSFAENDRNYPINMLRVFGSRNLFPAAQGLYVKGGHVGPISGTDSNGRDLAFAKLVMIDPLTVLSPDDVQNIKNWMLLGEGRRVVVVYEYEVADTSRARAILEALGTKMRPDPQDRVTNAGTWQARPISGHPIIDGIDPYDANDLAGRSIRLCDKISTVFYGGIVPIDFNNGNARPLLLGGIVCPNYPDCEDNPEAQDSAPRYNGTKLLSMSLELELEICDEIVPHTTTTSSTTTEEPDISTNASDGGVILGNISGSGFGSSCLPEALQTEICLDFVPPPPYDYPEKYVPDPKDFEEVIVEPCALVLTANKSVRLELERDLFDPNRTYEGSLATVKLLTRAKGYDVNKYAPYLRVGNRLRATSYDTVVATGMSIILVDKSMDVSRREGLILDRITSREILPDRMRWPDQT